MHAQYKCPICDDVMPRDLILFKEHTDKHIIDAIVKNHPDWVSEDGVCRKCVEYYEKQLGK